MKTTFVYSMEDSAAAGDLRAGLESAMSGADDSIEIFSPGEGAGDTVQVLSSDVVVVFLSGRLAGPDSPHRKFLKELVSAHRRGDIRLFPVVAEKCEWREFVPDGVTVLPRTWASLAESASREKAVAGIVEDVERFLKVFRGIKSAMDEITGENQAGVAPGITAELRELLVSADAVAARMESLESNSLSAVDSDILHEAGAVYYGERDFEKALFMHRRALDIRLAVLGEEHSDTAASFNETACALDALGRRDEALEHFGKALDLFEKTLGWDHPDTAACHTNIAGTLRSSGRYQDALRHLETARIINVEVYGDRHEQSAVDINNIGLLFYDTGEFVKAKKFFEEALEIDFEVRGHNDPVVAERLNNLSMALTGIGEAPRALDCIEKAIEIDIRTFGPHSSAVARDHNNLGTILRGMGDTYSAEVHYRKALVAAEIFTHGDDRKMLDCLHNLANLLIEKEDFIGAVGYLVRIERAVLENPDYSDDDYSTACHNLGIALYMTGDFHGAGEYMKKALVIRSRLFGEDHPDTKAVAENLRILKESIGEPGDVETE